MRAYLYSKLDASFHLYQFHKVTALMIRPCSLPGVTDKDEGDGYEDRQGDRQQEKQH